MAGNSITGISGLDYNDPYLHAALASTNINFRGGSSYVAQNDATAVANPYAAYSTSTGATVPQVSFAAAGEENNSDTGMIVGGALALAAAAGACIIGHNAGKGKGIIQGWKNIWNKWTSSSAAKTVKEATTQLTAINTKKGVRYVIPGKRTDMKRSETEIANLIKDNDLDISAERLGLTGDSVIDRFFLDTRTIKIKDGEIVEILGKDGKPALKKLQNAKEGTRDNIAYNKILKVIEELAKGKDADKKVLNSLKDIHYTNTSGDEIFEMMLENYGATATQADIKGLSTLKRFTLNDQEIQSYVLSESEKILISAGALKDGKLSDGLTLGEFKTEINGKVCYFDGKKLVAVEGAGGEKLAVGSLGADKWLEEEARKGIFGRKVSNREAVEAKLEAIFEKRSEKIPEGAVIKIAA